MGQKLAGMAQQVLNPDSDPKEKKMQDMVKNLKDMAKTAQALFQIKLEKSLPNDKTIPIDRIFKYEEGSFAKVDTKADQTINGVNSVVESLGTGQYKQAITSLVTNSLDILFSKTSSGYQKEENYFITMLENGGVIRIDYFLMAYQFRTSGLKELMGSIVVYKVAKSIAKIQDLRDNPNTLKVVIENSFPTQDVDELREMYNTIQARIQKPSHKKVAGQEELKEDEEDDSLALVPAAPKFDVKGLDFAKFYKS